MTDKKHNALVEKKKKAQTQTYTYRRTIKYAEKKKTVNNLQLCFAQA